MRAFTACTIIDLGAAAYDLLLLTCVIDGERNIAGVAAIAANAITWPVIHS